MGCIWQPFWILQEKVQISFYFWISRVVNSQLAMHSHVRCNPPQHPNTSQMTITNFNYEGSYLPGLICNNVVKADLGRSTPQYWHLVVKNGNWQICWQIYPSGADIWWSWLAIGRSASRSTSQCWHVVVKTGNWQICQQIYPQMHHGIYIMGCIWQPLWILQEKVGISFYFWIRLVNSQLALYSHVRCTCPWQPWHPWNIPKTPPHDNYKFQIWCLILARCNM